MKAMQRILIPLVLVALLGVAAAGCGSPTKTPSTTTSAASSSTATTTTTAVAEPDYASAITDTLLKALNDDSLENYVKYGNAQFKAAVTQEIMDTTSSQINNQLGTYESKTYLSTETQGGYIIVHYRATYSKGEVGVRVIFDQDHLVAGQFFE